MRQRVRHQFLVLQGDTSLHLYTPGALDGEQRELRHELPPDIDRAPGLPAARRGAMALNTPAPDG